MTRRVDERGSALLVALGMLALLSIMGVTFVILTRMEMQAAIHFDNMTRARILAENGLERALAELRPLSAGPVFRPRFDRQPPNTRLVFRISKPYSSTVAAHVSETWGVRAVGLAGPATYTWLEDMVMPDPLSPESAPYLWSGPQRGRLTDGHFDTRARLVPKQADGTQNQTFRIVRGVVDLSGLVDLNGASVQTLEGVFTYFGVPNPAQVANDIVFCRNDGPGVPRPFRYLRELVDHGILTLPQLYGEDANGNGVLDPGEDTNGNGLLDGALRDAITVAIGWPFTRLLWRSDININTAPEPVLFAVFYRVLNDPAKAVNLARAVIAYRAGADHIEGAVSERDPDGDGNPIDAADLTGDGDTDDLYCDDNPFDGVFDGVLYPAIVPGGVAWLPEFSVGANEWQDIDGDTVPPELVSGFHPSFDQFIFPNGPGGFSEFEHFMDSVNAWFGVGLSQQEIDYVKYNATRRDDVTYATLPPPTRVVTTTFRYQSDCWLVISEGRVERGGELQATVTLTGIVGYQ